MSTSEKILQHLYNSYICRLCSEENGNGRLLYNTNDSECDASILINSYLPIKIADDGIFPRWICPGCYIQVESTAQFFEMIIKGQEHLRIIVKEKEVTGEISSEEKNISEFPESLIDETTLDDASQDQVTENILFASDQEICLRINGEKPKKKRGRPPRPTLEVLEAQRLAFEKEQEEKRLELQSEQEKDNSDSEGRRKRKIKVPVRYEGIVQGKELEKVYKDEGVLEFDQTLIKNELIIDDSNDDDVIGYLQSEIENDLGGLVVEQEKDTGNRKRKTKYICDVCDRSFLQEYRYLIHRKAHNVSYECTICLEQFSERLKLSEHQELTQHRGEGIVESLAVNKTIKEEPTTQVRTEKSEEIVENAMDIVVEQKQTVGVEKKSQKSTKTYPCESCNRVFTSLSSIIYHEESVHNDGRLYVCYKCNKTFKHRQLLRRHQLVHATERPFTCSLCGSSFKTKSILNNHQLSHQGVKKFDCTMCDQKFPYKTSLNLHLKWHKGEKPFKCDVCEKSFSQRGNLKEHQRIHSGEKPYTCEECSKSFTTSSQYNLHIKRHNGVRPHHCDQCNKSFLLIDNYKTHLRRHNGEKPFPCTFCFRKFSEKWALTKHMRSHTGFKPYNCNLCDKKFADHSNYTKHQRSHSVPNSRPVKPLKTTNNKTAPTSLLKQSIVKVDPPSNVVEETPKMWHVIGSIDDFNQNTESNQFIYVTYDNEQKPIENELISNQGGMSNESTENQPVLISYKTEIQVLDSENMNLGHYNSNAEIPAEVLLGLESNNRIQFDDQEQNSSIELITSDGQKIRVVTNLPEPLDLLNEF